MGANAGHVVYSYQTLREWIAAGDLQSIRRYSWHKGDVAPIALGEALQICLLIREQEPERLERAAMRWIVRFINQTPGLTLPDLLALAGAFEDLQDAPDDAMERLAGLCVRYKIRLG